MWYLIRSWVHPSILHPGHVAHEENTDDTDKIGLHLDEATKLYRGKIKTITHRSASGEFLRSQDNTKSWSSWYKDSLFPIRHFMFKFRSRGCASYSWRIPAAEAKSKALSADNKMPSPVATAHRNLHEKGERAQSSQTESQGLIVIWDGIPSPLLITKH